MKPCQPIITSLGCYTPPGVLTNFDLEKMVNTNNQWIVERTGISERHIATPEIASSDMAVSAAREALEQRGIPASDLEVIIVCTVTPDMMFPATACLVQNQLGANRAWGYDLSAACSGYLYGLNAGAALVASGAHRKVLVIGTDTMSRIIDYTDRSTCILFGDGAGAMLIEPASDGDRQFGFIDFIGEIDGSGGDFLKMPAGGSRLPASEDTVESRLHYVKQEGQQVFKYAVRKMYELCDEILRRNGFTAKDLGLLVPHQANKRIIDGSAHKLGIAPEKVVITVDRHGNTSAASIPLALFDAVSDRRIRRGHLVLLEAMGGGFTWGSALLRW